MKKLIGIFLASILLVGCQEAQIKEETIVEPVEPEQQPINVGPTNVDPMTVSMGRTRTKTTKKSVKRVVKK